LEAYTNAAILVIGIGIIATITTIRQRSAKPEAPTPSPITAVAPVHPDNGMPSVTGIEAEESAMPASAMIPANPSSNLAHAGN
jgi:hypothetical protein